MAELCFGCFCMLESAGTCPVCGYTPGEDKEKYPSALKAGSILKERYIVGRVLGQGGFGITYAAQDFATQQRVAIKEFMPTSIASRESTGQVSSYGNQQANFEQGKLGFMDEANSLVGFKNNPYVVNILDFFEENGTAYFVMEYVQGTNLKSYIKVMGGKLGEDEANRILVPIMEALQDVHSKGLIHRDIAPDNIIVTSDGSAKLIDFGAARYSTGEKSLSLDVILKHGYAPKEQYMRRGRQGPFTDVYAMAATYYYTITGRVPPDALERGENDELPRPSALGIEISPQVEAALFKALQVQAEDRFQTMAEFTAAIKGESVVDASAPFKSKYKNPLLAKADTCINEKKWDEAAKYCDSVLAEKPGDKDALLLKHMIELEKANAQASQKESKAKRKKRNKRIVRFVFGLIFFSLIVFVGSLYLQFKNQWSFDETSGTLTINSDIGIESVIPGFIDKVNDIIFSAEEFVPGLTEFSTGWHIEMDKYIPGFSGETPPWEEHHADIRNVIIKDGVKTIPDVAFYDCTALKKVIIADSVTEIGYQAFYRCPNLEEVCYTGSYSQWGLISKYNICLPSSLEPIYNYSD